MRYTSLNAFEEKFLHTANNGEYNLRKISVPVPGENLKLEGYLCTPANRSGYYYDREYPKERIVIHYTAGNIKSDLSTLTSHNRHVSVPFVIARDGTIYQLFSSKFWSGHLGKGVGNTDTNNAEDKRTIGIELSNYGFLSEKSGNLETYYSRQKKSDGTFGPVDVYCSLTETDAYEKLNTPFRQQAYYATHTDAQYQSLIILLRYLTAQYNIQRQFLPEDIRHQAADQVLHFKGIVTHINYRKDGKWDIGPAFNWKAVIEGVQAVEFKPVLFRGAGPGTRGTGTEVPITSEREVVELLPKAMDPAMENESYEEIPRSVELEEDVEKNASPRKKKLFALLVGIDKYEGDIILNHEVTFPALSGCVPDSKKMKAYLENDPSFIADVKLITNKQATKAEVVRLFNEHLGQAEEGDVALFFYSGHGTQEWADTAWTEDTDGILECIVCYYDNNADEFLLADKELRFLINELASKKPHIVSIFDCCHSADNTRNGAKVKEAFDEAVEKRIPYVFRKRKWDHFIFSKEISSEDMKQKGETALLPEGLHIQFSACESDESAVEVAGAGVFTKALLKVLSSSGGEVSYHALGGRIRQYLKNVYEQKPRIYVAGGDKELLHSVFLDKSASPKKIAFGEVIYNQEKGWKFTLGAIHGIGEHNKKITITDPEEGDKIFEGEIGKIEIDSCEVNTRAKLNTDKIYNGSVEGLLTYTLKVNIQNTDGSLKNLQRLMDSLFEADQKYIVAEDEEDDAEYVVRINNSKYFITRPIDAFRPVAAPVIITGMRSAKAIAAQLKHISRWEFLKNLKNENERDKLPDNAVKIELISEATKKLLSDKNNTAVINYKEKDGEWENSIRVRLTNTAPVNIYCAALYLTSDFSSFIEFLNPPVYLLEPGNSVELAMDKDPVLKLEYSKVAKFYNWNEEVEFLKFIISTDVFDVQALSLEALPKPVVPGDRLLAGSRGIDVSKGINKRKPEGWTTQTVTLRLQNPHANKIYSGDLDAMLRDPDLEYFARGLYFDKISNGNPEVKYSPKQSIEIPAT